MDVVLVKKEENSTSTSNCARRRLSVTEGEGTKCIKRRRRGDHIQDKKGEKGVLPVDQSGSATGAGATAAKRSSRFRGVSRHRWTGRFEAHLWDKGSWNATQKKKGKQVYLGAYDEEESAARAYDLAALKYWGPTTFTNFPVSDYEKEIQIMQNVTKEEYLASLRRKSSGFSRGVSKYRGVARHHHNGRWEARIGRVFGNKYLYLGTYSTQEEAAAAYDIAAIEYRGINAVTNFDLSTYIRWLRPGSNNGLLTQHQEPARPSSENRAVLTLNQVPTLVPAGKEEPADACFRYINPFVQDDVVCSPHKQAEYSFQTRQNIPNVQYSCNKSSSSSPTALSLLLRSSIFRELVEKNSSAAENIHDEVDGADDVVVRSQLRRQQIINSTAGSTSDDEYPAGVNFYDGIADVPLLCSNKYGIASLAPEMDQLQEESGASYYDPRLGQGLWSNVVNMSSMQYH